MIGDNWRCRDVHHSSEIFSWPCAFLTVGHTQTRHSIRSQWWVTWRILKWGRTIPAYWMEITLVSSSSGRRLNICSGFFSRTLLSVLRNWRVWRYTSFRISQPGICNFLSIISWVVPHWTLGSWWRWLFAPQKMTSIFWQMHWVGDYWQSLAGC